MKEPRIRKPFRYTGFLIDIINIVISFLILGLFIVIALGYSWRYKYLFLAMLAGVVANIIAGVKFIKQKRILQGGILWVFAAILFVLSVSEIFRFIF